MKDLETDNVTLKKIVTEQQTFIEQVKREKVANNLLITGIPVMDIKDDNDVTHSTIDQKISYLMAAMDVDPDIVNDNTYTVKLLTKPGSNARTQFTKVFCNDITVKRHIITKKVGLSQLDQHHPCRRIFVKHDEPLLTRKENERLQKKRYNLAQTNDNVQLRSGKLTIDGNEVDHFNLANQLYQGNWQLTMTACV